MGKADPNGKWGAALLGVTLLMLVGVLAASSATRERGPEPAESPLTPAAPEVAARMQEAVSTSTETQAGAESSRPPRFGYVRGGSPLELTLRWLRDHQDADGKWDGDGFSRHDPPDAPCAGAATLRWIDPALTGLASLVFLNAGHTHRYGRHKLTVRKAMRYLMTIQAASGQVGGRWGHHGLTQAITTAALTESYGMTKSPLIRGAARKAVEHLLRQQAASGGWSSRPGEPADIYTTCWAVLAVKSARASSVGVENLDRALRAANEYVEGLTNEDGLTGYRARPDRGTSPSSARLRYPGIGFDSRVSHAPTHTPTAIATCCRVMFGYKRSDPRLERGARLVLSRLPRHDDGGARPSEVDFCYWLHGTTAMFQMGRDYWKRWHKAVSRAVVDHQVLRGSGRGSWDPSTPGASPAVASTPRRSTG